VDCQSVKIVWKKRTGNANSLFKKMPPLTVAFFYLQFVDE